MFVLKYVCIKICLFFNKKNNKKTAADRPTDLGTVAARAVGRSVGRWRFVWFYLFINKHILIKNKHISKQTYFKTNIHNHWAIGPWAASLTKIGNVRTDFHPRKLFRWFCERKSY